MKPSDPDRLLFKRKGLSGSEFAGLGMQFAATIVASALAGVWLDERLGTTPWLVIVMTFAGAGLGFWSMYRKAVGRTSGAGRPGDGGSR